MLENHNGVRPDHSTLSQHWQQCVHAVIAVRRIGEYEIDREGSRRVHSGNVRGFARLPLRFTRRGA